MINIALNGTGYDASYGTGVGLAYSMHLRIDKEEFGKRIPVKTPDSFYLRSIAINQGMYTEAINDMSVKLYVNDREVASVSLMDSSLITDLSIPTGGTLAVMVDDLPLRAKEWWKSISKYCPAVSPNEALHLYDHRDEIDAQETPEGKRMLIGMLLATEEARRA